MLFPFASIVAVAFAEDINYPRFLQQKKECIRIWTVANHLSESFGYYYQETEDKYTRRSDKASTEGTTLIVENGQFHLGPKTITVVEHLHGGSRSIEKTHVTCTTHKYDLTADDKEQDKHIWSCTPNFGSAGKEIKIRSKKGPCGQKNLFGEKDNSSNTSEDMSFQDKLSKMSFEAKQKIVSELKKPSKKERTEIP